MSVSLTFRTEWVEVEAHLPLLPNRLIDALEQFTQQHYHIVNLAEFNENVLGLGKVGGLGVFYDKSDKIIGFTRICRQVIQVKGRTVTVYSGGSYHNPRFDLNFTAAKFCLAKAMRYKLERPEEEMVYFSHANTPARYQFLAKLSNTIYPKEGIRIPDFVLSLVDSLKKHNHWESHATHPMLISGQMPLLNFPVISVDTTDPLTSYYSSLNPEYYTGNSLLVYLPLNLANISLGIKRVLTPRKSS